MRGAARADGIASGDFVRRETVPIWEPAVETAALLNYRAFGIQI
jgi:hypothetical protein